MNTRTNTNQPSPSSMSGLISDKDFLDEVTGIVEEMADAFDKSKSLTADEVNAKILASKDRVINIAVPTVNAVLDDAEAWFNASVVKVKAERAESGMNPDDNPTAKAGPIEAAIVKEAKDKSQHTRDGVHMLLQATQGKDVRVLNLEVRRLKILNAFAQAVAPKPIAQMSALMSKASIEATEDRIRDLKEGVDA